MLRPAVGASGGVLFAVGALSWAAGCTPLALQTGIPGLLLIAALLVERWRYKPLSDDRPGPDWVRTDERFVDPETGKLVTVFYRPATGERRYIGG